MRGDPVYDQRLLPVKLAVPAVPDLRHRGDRLLNILVAICGTVPFWGPAAFMAVVALCLLQVSLLERSTYSSAACANVHCCRVWSRQPVVGVCRPAVTAGTF